jgi:hypothetical protein
VMTPFAQMLQTQAVMNVTGKERYAVIPDEIIRYAIGRFGRPNVPIAPEIMDKIMANPRTKELEAEPGMAELSDAARDNAGEPGRRDESRGPGRAPLRPIESAADELAARSAPAHRRHPGQRREGGLQAGCHGLANLRSS